MQMLQQSSNESKEQLSPQLISIYYMISLTKMSRKIIKDIPWMMHLYHLTFLPFNIYAKVINDIKNRK